MKLYKWLPLLALAAILLSACTPSSGATVATPTSEATVPSQGGLQTLPAVNQAIAFLAQQLGMDVTDIKEASHEPVEWSDSCLGAGGPAESCALVMTPGYRVMLQAGGKNYELHTNTDGTQIRLFTAPGPASDIPPTGGGAPVFTWHREGGIAGFCDELAVDPTGQAEATSCKGNSANALGRFQLTPEQMEKVSAWAARFASFELEEKDAAVSDAMLVRLVFTGSGSEQPTEAQQQEIAAFAQEVFTNRPQ